MMIAPQVVGVLRKKPEQLPKLSQQQQQQKKQQHEQQQGDSGRLHLRIPPLDPQDTKIRGKQTATD